MRQLFLLFFCFFSPLVAQQDLLPNGKETSKEQELPPNPQLLKPAWWDFFTVDPEKLPAQIEKMKTFLHRMQEDLTPTQQSEVAPLIQQIQVGLQRYSDISKQKWSQPPPEVIVKEKYTFQEFLQLGYHLRDVHEVCDRQELKIVMEKANLRSDQSYLDSLTVSYLSLSKADPSRLIKGLTIIGTKISLETDKKRLDGLKIQADREKILLHEIQKEVAFARGHIDISQIALPLFEQEVTRAKIQLRQAQVSLLEKQTQLATQESTEANSEILNQTLMRSRAEVNLIRAQLTYILAQILLHPEKKTVKDLYSQLNELSEKQTQIIRELEHWEKAANHLLELSIEIDDNGKAHTSLQTLQVLHDEIFFNEFLLTQADQFIQIRYISLGDRIHSYWEKIKSDFRRYSRWSHVSLFKIGQAPITFYGILKLICTIVIAYFLAKFIQIWINFVGKRQKKINQAGFYTLGRLLYYCIMILGIIIAISSIGIDFTTFAVIVGALSVGIGFGLQSIVNNFISGIILLLEKKLRVRDYVQLESGEIGVVMEINVRTTLIKTFDNVEVLVPNADLVSKKFINWTLSDKIRRLRIPFSVAFGSDKDKVKEAAIDAAMKVPTTIKDRQPQVWHVGIGESSLDFELVVWVNEHQQGLPPIATKAMYTWEIESALRRYNISIPFPVRDVRITETPPPKSPE
ncbi:MAG: mechanosensitive ion channel [Simkania sp.]|nr:mechanosensitive ion channel [Simkania sp.]MCP5489671.1 mechanosensitive ion channel [Chlamydiales bacterium]